jgi:protein tyrosine/serine phosphatase
VRERILDWPGLANVRDLGGLPGDDGRLTVPGRLVRADDIGLAGAPAWEAATGYGIRTVLDLRFPDERERRGSPDGLRVVPVSVLGERDPVYWDMLHAERDRVGEEGYMAFSYASFLDRHAELFAEAVTTFASAGDGGVVVHCVAGKDRTGLVVGLLLRAAGVPLSVVDEDYALSERCLASTGYVSVDYRGLNRVPRSPAGTLLDVFGRLEAEHGSAEGYLLAAGCGPDVIDAVRRRLLEP